MVTGIALAVSVEVRGRPYAVSFYHKSEAVWVTVGEYMGGTIQVRDRSADAAIRRWIDTAEG
jgi:hypothetical protein